MPPDHTASSATPDAAGSHSGADATPQPAPPRPAASVLLCRDGAAGLEVFMVQRHTRSTSHGGAYVFPGGKVDAADAELGADRLDSAPAYLQARLHDPALDAAAARAFHVAALRELFEECGVLLAHDIDGTGQRRAAALARDGMPFELLLERLGLRLDTQALQPWSRWITPARALTSPSARFDTYFFLARMPATQTARHDDHEAVHSAWLAPRTALARYWQGEISMAPPQLMSLAHLARHADVDSLLAEARERAPAVIRPHIFDAGDARGTAYPGDPLHLERTRALPGPLRLTVRAGRLEPTGGFDAFFEDH